MQKRQLSRTGSRIVQPLGALPAGRMHGNPEGNLEQPSSSACSHLEVLTSPLTQICSAYLHRRLRWRGFRVLVFGHSLLFFTRTYTPPFGADRRLGLR